MRRARVTGMPAFVNAALACCWWSSSVSIDVSVAAGAPRSSQRPLTPAPVPTSRIAVACVDAATAASCAPTAGAMGVIPSSTEASRAAVSTSSSLARSSRYLAMSDSVGTVPPPTTLAVRRRRRLQARRRVVLDYPGVVSLAGITLDKLLLIAVLAAILIGPERLPALAEKLGALVRGLRDLAGGAKERMREEMGPEFDEVDWRRLDPRQYDPRRIVMDALRDDPKPQDFAAAAAASSVATVTGLPRRDAGPDALRRRGHLRRTRTPAAGERSLPHLSGHSRA